MSLKLITDATQEPWTLEVAKAHLRITIDAEDELIREYLVAARRWVESETKRALISQVWEYSLPDWPLAWENDNGAIRLPLGRCLSVQEIRYRNTSDVETTLTGPTSDTPGTDYQEDLSSDEGGVVSPTPDDSWPSLKGFRLRPVIVKFTAGYGTDPSDVPSDLRMAVLYRLSDLHEYRGSFDGEGTENARQQIDSYRMRMFA